MPMKRYKPEQIVALLRQIEVEIAKGNHPASLQGTKLNKPASSQEREMGECNRYATEL